MFSHEKLVVYQRLLRFASYALDVCATWDRRHAIVDHLSRAMESVLANPKATGDMQSWITDASCALRIDRL